MTKREVKHIFDCEILPGIQRLEQRNGGRDQTMRRTAWNDHVDALYKDGKITERQADTWQNPYDK